MVGGPFSKLADEVKSRIGALALVLSLLSFVAGVFYFLSDAKLVEGLDLGHEAGIFGWYLMVLSLFLAAVAFVFGVTMQKG